MSDKKKYFEKLKDELKDLPLKERLLQELSDHVEDLEQEQAKPLTPEKMRKAIGEPKYVKEAYYKTLNPLRALYFLAEGLFCGLLVLPLGFASFLSQGRMIDLFYPSDLGGGDRDILTILSMLLGFGLSLFLWFKAFSLAFRHWRKLSASTGYPLWLWIVLILLPTAIFRGGLFIAMLSIFLECPTCNEYPMSDLASIVIPVLTAAGVMGLGAWFAWKKSKQPTKEKNIQWTQKMVFVFALYLIAYAVLRTGASYGLMEGLSVQNLWMAPFSPLFFFEYMTLLVGISLGLGVTNGIWTVGFMGLVLFFLILQALIDLLKNKRIAWLRVSVAVWALSLIVVNPQGYITDVEWQKSVWSVSENIEREQHGILYGLLKFANQDEGRLYRYRVDWSDEKFILTQNEELVFSIDPTKPNEAKYEKKIDAEALAPGFDRSQMALPESLKCFSKNSDFEGLVPADFYDCNTLTWKGETIFTMEYWTTITDFAFSDDEKWLMLVIQNGAYDPEDVYLVEL